MTRSLESIRSIPGVVAVGATNTIPLGGANNATIILAEGYLMKPGESAVVPLYIGATPQYFEAMGIRLLQGRTFDDGDTETSLPVIVIELSLASTDLTMPPMFAAPLSTAAATPAVNRICGTTTSGSQSPFAQRGLRRN